MTTDLISWLVALGSEKQIRLGQMANWCCEYCGLYLLKDADTYKNWEIDHIVPQCEGGSVEFDNLAIAEHVIRMRARVDAELSAVRAAIAGGAGLLEPSSTTQL